LAEEEQDRLAEESRLMAEREAADARLVEEAHQTAER
jgi:hypothetical protein